MRGSHLCVNHCVITAPIIRYRDIELRRKARESRELDPAVSSSGGGLADRIRFTRELVVLRRTDLTRLRRSRSLWEIGNRREKVSITRSTEYVAISWPIS